MSHNQCSFPGCNQPLVVPLTSDPSNYDVCGEVCHIIAARKHGPRPNVDATDEQLIQPSNLILMCKSHHHEIDKNPELYTADCLRKMKRDHETSVRPEVVRTSRALDISLFSISGFPIEIINRRVVDETTELYEQSFYIEFDGVLKATDLYQQLRNGDLSIASANVRSESIAMIATVLERLKQHEQATEAIAYAMSLAKTQTTLLARARIAGTKSDKSQLLQQLNATATPIARTAALLLTARLDGSNAALDWYDKSGLRADMFDPEGQFILCTMMLRSAYWNKAVDTALMIPPESFTSIPALHHIIAMIHLVTTVPIEYRHALIDCIPLNAQDYRISDTPDALDHRRTAVSHFYAAAKAAAAYGLSVTNANEERYAIWLQLRDPETGTRESAQKLLRTRLRTVGSTLPFMHLGIQFGELEDLDSAQRELESQCALNGGETADSIEASLSILIKTGSPASIAKFIEEKFNELVKYIDEPSLMKTRIRTLAAAGEGQRANELLARASEILSIDDKDDIVALIDAQSADSEFQLLERRYESRGRRLSDLQTLVAYLEESNQWQKMCQYGRELFNKTHSAKDATLLARSCYETNQPQVLCELVREEVTLLSLSAHLRLLYSWALHSVGDFQEARSQLEHISSDIDDRGDRTLRMRLDISTGNWENLNMYIQQELKHANNSNANELLIAAKLATRIRSPRAMEVIRAVAQKGWDDPEVIATCYSLAIRLAREGDDDVSNWPLRAVELSPSDGPMKMISIDDVLRYQYLQAKNEARIQSLVVAAKIPTFLAAHHLGCGVVDFTLVRAMRNANTFDIRDKLPIPAYSSNRRTSVPDDVRILGIDATAILSLAYLEILRTTIDSFENIVISSSMLEWLFDEDVQSTFHQPSLLIEATQLLNLLNDDCIRQIEHQRHCPYALQNAVGNDLATLLYKAYSVPSDCDVRHIVVHLGSYLVHGSDEEAIDVFAEYKPLLTSCSAVVDWLKLRGLLPESEIRVARAFLIANEEECPSPVDITEGSHLYLSRTAIMCLHRLRLLDKLTRSGVAVNVSRDSIREARSVQSQAGVFGAASDEITRIRRILVSGIDEGKVHFAKRTKIAESGTDRFAQHPNVDLIPISEESDAIVCDDRVCNKYLTVDQSSRRVPILNTLELIDMLVGRGCLETVQRDLLRTKLREAGFVLVPVTEDEIVRFLQASTVVDGRVNETAELKAIRSNLQMMRVHGWFHQSVDYRWMNCVFTTIARAMPKLWTLEMDRERTMAYSYWLRQQFNVRHYGHFFDEDEAFAQMRRYGADFILEILNNSHDLTLSNLANFFDWFDEAMIKPLRWIDEEAYDMVLERQSAWASDVADRAINSPLVQSPTHDSVSASDVVDAIANRVPPSLRDAISITDNFIAKDQLEDSSIISFNQPAITVYRRSLLDSLGRLFNELRPVSVATPDGQQCIVGFGKQYPSTPVLSRDNDQIVLENFLMFSPESSTRISSFNATADYYEVPSLDRKRWNTLLLDRIPSADEFEAITGDLKDSPARHELLIAQAVKARDLQVDMIVPASQRYYSRLIGSYDMSETVDSFVQNGLGVLLGTHVDGVEEKGIHRCLLTAIHPSVVDSIPLTENVATAMVSAFEYITGNGDAVSQVAAVELACRFLGIMPGVGRLIGSLVDSIRGDDVDSPCSRFAMFYHLFVIIDSRLIALRVLAGMPPFYRRAAALAQAALVQSVILDYGVRSDALANLAQSPQSIYHRLQSVAEMRREPLWHPGSASPEYFKSNSVARVRGALVRARERLGGARFGELVGVDVAAMCDDDELSSLEVLPSPLDGAILGLSNVSVDIMRSIRSIFNASDRSLAEVRRVATYLRFVRTERDVVEHFERLLVEFRGAIKSESISDGDSSWVSLLASVAGTTRSGVVTDFVHSLLLQMCSREHCTVDVGTICEIGIVACSSRSDVQEWRDSVSVWFRALVDLDLDPSQMRVLALILDTLCFLFPELWISCGRWYAALEASRR